jgi:hypothetical protein
LQEAAAALELDCMVVLFLFFLLLHSPEHAGRSNVSSSETKDELRHPSKRKREKRKARGNYQKIDTREEGR